MNKSRANTNTNTNTRVHDMSCLKHGNHEPFDLCDEDDLLWKKQEAQPVICNDAIRLYLWLEYVVRWHDQLGASDVAGAKKVLAELSRFKEQAA